MTFQQELNSWFSPKSSHPIAPSPPAINSPAPSTPKLPFPSNNPNPQPTILLFLRHCGCPFAEKSYLNLRTIASTNPTIACIAISHSNPTATANWLHSLPASPPPDPQNLTVIVDDDLEVYRAWGLGSAGFAHALSPGSLYQVWKTGREEGIWNRPTESGSRWQVGGAFAVGEQGEVVWGRADGRADDVPDFGEVVGLLLKGRGA